MFTKVLGPLAIAAAVAVLPIGASASSLKVSGSTTVASAIMLPMEGQIEGDTGVALEVTANGSSRGIDDLINGRSQLAMISAPLEVTVAKIEKKSPGSLDGTDLQGHMVGETRVAFVVHPSNPVQSLTLVQVADVLSGSVTNWSQLGGLDMPIVIVAETLGGGLRTLVESELTDGASIAGTVREFPNATQVPQVASQFPPAFGLAPFKAAGASDAKILETDQAISQPLILVTNGTVSEEMQAVIDATRKAGS